MNDIISTLGLTPNEVQEIHSTETKTSITIFLKTVSRGAFCKNCHTYTKKVHSYYKRNIKHEIFKHKKCTVIQNTRRYICPQCGKTVAEDNPLSGKNTNISDLTVEIVLKMLKDYSNTFSAVARNNDLSVTKVIEIFDKYVQPPRKKFPKVMCMDEIYFNKNADNKYCVILIDFKNGTILDAIKSRRKKVLNDYFRSIDKKELSEITHVSMDMYETYRSTVKRFMPAAMICVDSFHVLKVINETLDKCVNRVRRKYEDNKNSDEYYLLKHKKHLLFKGLFNISNDYKYNKHFKYMTTDRIMFERIIDLDDEIHQLWLLKESYYSFNKDKYMNISNLTEEEIKEKRETELDRIISECTESRYRSIRKIGFTLFNWKNEILNSFNTAYGRRISNGPIEGRNKYIKLIKALANGYINFPRFRNRIMYSLNKYEKPSEEELDTTVKAPGIKRGSYKK